MARQRDCVRLFLFSRHGFGGTDDALILASDFGTADVPLLMRALSIIDIE